MAEELRHHMTASGSNTVSATDVGTSLVNRTKGTLYIRRLGIEAIGRAMAPGEGAIVGASKDPTTGGDGEEWGRWTVGVAGMTTGATPVDGAQIKRKDYAFARGELTLEPGERLYTHVTLLASGPTVDSNTYISYHY